MNSASLRANVTEILHSQIKYLICLPPMLPKTVMLDLPEDQHRVVNTIIQNLGPISKKKCPYFFITGSEYLLLMKSQWSQFHYLHSFQTYLHRSSNIWRHNVIVVGDLAQLPPVHGEYQICLSFVCWHLFYPFFINQPQRYQANTHVYQMLEEIRFGNISDETW